MTSTRRVPIIAFWPAEQAQSACRELQLLTSSGFAVRAHIVVIYWVNLTVGDKCANGGVSVEPDRTIFCNIRTLSSWARLIS